MRVARKPIALLAAAALLIGGAAFLLHMRHVLHQSAQEVAASHSLRYRLGPLQLPRNPGFEAIAAPETFRSAAVLADSLYVAGAGGLTEYQNGEAKHVFRVGQELPAAPLVSVLAARLRGAEHAQLLIATHGAGVLVYDPPSVSFRQLLPEDAALRDVTALAVLESGDLLIATHTRGVLLFDGGALRLYRPEYANAAMTSLAVSGEDVWAGTEEHGLLHTHAGVTDRFEAELPDPHISALAVSGDRVFAATPAGVAEFDNGRPTRTLARGLFARALQADADTLTLAAYGQGTVQLPLGETRARIHPAALEVADTHDAQFFSTPDGTLYAVRSTRVVERHGAAWLPIVQAAGSALADRNIAALAFDADGRLWAGSFDHGLDVLDPTLASAHHLEDDHLFCINRIVLDPVRGTMDVATANGLVLFDRTAKPRQILGRRDGLLSDHVTDIAFTALGLAVATPAGLSFVRDTGIDSLYAFEGLVNNHVYSLAGEGDTLLAGTLGGLSVLQHDAVARNLTVSNSGLRHNWITAIAHVGNGYIIGTYGGGLERMDASSKVQPMDGAPRDLILNPNALLSVGERIYAGSLDRGLWVYSPGAARWSQITAGLPSLNVTALAERNGELYVGTENGLVRIQEEKLPQ
jgi:ligand-binding sensor domain-containing protein